MNFKQPWLKAELARAHPDCREVAARFEAWSAETGLPEPCITAISRRPDFYALNKLPANENSWHLVDCAVDFRISQYTYEQLATAIRWFERELLGKKDTRTGGRLWEVVSKLHGTGPHIHIGRRDFRWRDEFKAKEKQNGVA
jgi:hypothetical protein